MKLISVVLPTYNGARWLKQSIESILNQTYRKVELIIVDDCSKDGTYEICEAFAKKDSRVKVVHNVENQKLPRSLNIGFEKARGDYYTWTSDDNWYELDAFEQMVAHLERHPDDVMVVADFDKINGLQRTTVRVQPTPSNMIMENSVGACFLYRADVARRVGAYDEGKFLVEDYDYWLRISLFGDIGKIDKILYHYRLHSKSLTNTRAKEVRRIGVEERRQMLPLYKEKFKTNSFQAVQEDIDIYDFLYKKDSGKYAVAKKSLRTRKLYKMLSRLYKETADGYYLSQIKRLGVCYSMRVRLWKLKTTRKDNGLSRCIENAFKWIRNFTVDSKGIAIESGQPRTIYPEVTGYFIPTLLKFSDEARAIGYADYLISIQNEDGSWNDPGGAVAYTFDTGMILKGLVALVEAGLDRHGSYRCAAIRGADWILSMQRTDGSIATPDYSWWGLPHGKFVPEAIHVYCLEPIRKIGHLTHDPKYEACVKKALDYYLAQEDLTDFVTLSHFNAYIIEGLIDLGEIKRAQRAMNLIALHQRADGSVSGYSNLDFVCSTGLFQYAICWYKLGEKDRADAAFKYAMRLQNRSGGWYGSYTVARDRATYFPKGEIAWAVKYFLDAVYYRRQKE